MALMSAMSDGSLSVTSLTLSKVSNSSSKPLAIISCSLIVFTPFLMSVSLDCTLIIGDRLTFVNLSLRKLSLVKSDGNSTGVSLNRIFRPFGFNLSMPPRKTIHHFISLT